MFVNSVSREAIQCIMKITIQEEVRNMISDRHFPKIIIALMAVVAVVVIVAVGFSETISSAFGGTGVTMEYEDELFNTDEIIEINIKMDEDEWNEMLANAMTEEYYSCDVVVNGKTFYNVGIRPKGNTSLSAIVMDPDTDRYSLKLEFGHFVEGQSCYGLDKLILNNNYADATNMKEAIIYDMFQYLGADASLYNYAKVSLNGEYTGVYLALEGVEQSFMLRNYGTQDGELYKPESMGMGGGGKSSGSSSRSDGPSFGGFPGGDFNPEDMPEMGDFDFSKMPGGSDFNPDNMPGGGESDAERMPGGIGLPGGDVEDSDDKARPGEGSPFGNGGANLNYTDDDLDSYSTIWEGEITGTGDADHRRVVTALKNINEGTDLEKYLDVDNVLKYMAVHTFAVNMDSLSGTMAHNYYLYEYDGQLNILPWDYNLSLGGMGMGGSSDGTSVVNDAIDTPFSGTDFFDALLENEEYLAKYHEYLRQLSEEYVEGGRFDEVYSRIRSRIDSLVETDPTAFYSGSEYNEAAEVLYETFKLRAESVKGQLNGTIPSTDEGQSEDSSNLVDGSSLDISAMGQFSMGGGGFGGHPDRKSDDGSSDDKDSIFDKSDHVPFTADTDLVQEGNDSENEEIELPAGIKENKHRHSPRDGADMSGRSFDQDKLKTLSIYGGCLVVMILMIFMANGIKRRKK